MRDESRSGTREALRQRLKELATIHVRFGDRRLTVSLWREGWKVNEKRVYLIYAQEGIQVRTKVEEEVSPARAAAGAARHEAESVVGDGLCQRQTGGRYELPRADGGESVMRGSASHSSPAGG